MALLELIDVEGDSQDEAESIVETWYCEYSDISSGYSLSYPAIGVAWETDSSYICSSLKFNREAKKYYSADSTKSSHNGADVCVLKATYTLQRNVNPEGEGEDAFSTRVASAGYQVFKINAGGNWGIIQKPCGYEASMYELKLPVLQIDKTITIIQSDPLDDSWYGSMVGKLNDDTFMGRARGCVLFESFSMSPRWVGDLVETELSLTFKILTQDWNWEWRNPVQAYSKTTHQPLRWQNNDANRPAYTTDSSKVNMPVWSGEISGYGDAAYGTGGWDYRVFGTSPNTTTFYEYADLSDLFEGEPEDTSNSTE